MSKGLSQEQKKIMLIVIAALTVLYVDFSYVLKPQLAGFKGASHKLKQLRLDLSQYNENSPYYKNLTGESGRLRKKYLDIEKYVFSDAGLPLLLDDISKKAVSLGVKIMQIKPAAVSAQKEKKDGKSADFQQVSIVLELAGGYHTIGKFLGALEANPLIEVSAVKINSQPQVPAVQKAAVTLKTYVQKK